MLADESSLTNGHLGRTLIDWIPGMPPISLGDVCSFVRTTDPDDFGLRFGLVGARPMAAPKPARLSSTPSTTLKPMFSPPSAPSTHASTPSVP
ncbi:7-deoxyloganetin glucosyltransferase-like [Hordeum vulgare]|nr:7-deoxyloganetin glucosyltransferase-like [Hordeum vulgare]